MWENTQGFMGRDLLPRMRPALRDAAIGVLARAGVLRPSRRSPRALTVVTFHRVLPEPERGAYPHPGLVVTPEELRWLCGFFSEHFTVGPMARQHGRFEAGERASKPLLALTFDDGQLDNYTFGRPVLEALGLRATFYVPVSHIESGAPLWHDRMGFALLGAAATAEGRRALRQHGMVGERAPAEAMALVAEVTERSKERTPEERQRWIELLEEASAAPPLPPWAGMMSWEQLRALARAGHEIGSHSMTHPLLPQCDERTIAFEVGESRRVLEAQLGTPIESFCYPNGDQDERCRQAVAAAGYRCAVTTRPGHNPPGSDSYALRRAEMHP